jgi:DNA-binding CsgD family transcriptional regulator
MRPLSGRERQILALIADGRSYQEIADALRLTIPTVGCYRGRLLDRLQLTTTGELIAYAREHALTTMPMLVIKRGRVRADRPQVTQNTGARGIAGVNDNHGVGLTALTQELTATQ